MRVHSKPQIREEGSATNQSVGAKTSQGELGFAVLNFTLDALIDDPKRAAQSPRQLIPGLLAEIDTRQSMLKSIERALLSLVIVELDASRGTGVKSDTGLWSARDLAEHWSVHESWVREQARDGNLPSVKMGHYVRFRPADCERFVTEHLQGKSPASITANLTPPYRKRMRSAHQLDVNDDGPQARDSQPLPTSTE